METSVAPENPGTIAGEAHGILGQEMLQTYEGLWLLIVIGVFIGGLLLTLRALAQRSRRPKRGSPPVAR